MRKTILIFGGLSAVLLILFELNKLSVRSVSDYSEVFIVISGVLFVGIGILISKFLNFKNGISSKQNLNKSNLSKQEYKVLLLMTEGLSNIEIGDRLFISESTVKSHVSNILSKLKAKRRTEAIKIGKELNII